MGMRMKYSVFIVFQTIWFLGVSGNMIDSIDLKNCNRVGECVTCAKSEMKETYCIETGNKQEFLCNNVSTEVLKNHSLKLQHGIHNKVVIFRSCTTLEASSEGIKVVIFEIFMLISFSVMFHFVQKRKLLHISLFDKRKDPTQNRNLLSSKTKD